MSGFDADTTLPVPIVQKNEAIVVNESDYHPDGGKYSNKLIPR